MLIQEESKKIKVKQKELEVQMSIKDNEVRYNSFYDQLMADK